MADLTLRSQREEAVRLLHAGRLQEAGSICRRILEAFPKHVAAYGVLGQILVEMGLRDEATNLFRRTLSADPESTQIYVSLAALHEERGQLEEAAWHLERALELAPGNPDIRRALQRLRRELCPGRSLRLKLTRASLARLYLRGQLHPQAIAELRALVSTQPERLDLRVALSEALWRNGQNEDAAVVAQGVLGELPNCLKANLVLGRIWLNTDRDEEARVLLLRAQALDPENVAAQAIFGARSPLPPRVVRLPFRQEEAPPLDLPYLVADEEVISEGVVIEGASALVSAEEAPLPEAKLSLLDVRRQYVRDHPEDYTARLDLARRLRNSGAMEEALAQYASLIQEDTTTLPEALRDLELLNRLYPGTPSLADLVHKAQERTTRGPTT